MNLIVHYLLYSFSIFRLSDYGVDIIGKCTYNGFHYHEERGLYETCRHVFLRWNVKKFKMVDFRWWNWKDELNVNM